MAPPPVLLACAPGSPWGPPLFNPFPSAPSRHPTPVPAARRHRAVLQMPCCTPLASAPPPLPIRHPVAHRPKPRSPRALSRQTGPPPLGRRFARVSPSLGNPSRPPCLPPPAGLRPPLLFPADGEDLYATTSIPSFDSAPWPNP
jgi:hypothetical protein